MEQRKNQYLVQGSVLAVASIITRIIGMLYKIPMTHMIGREGMAYYLRELTYEDTVNEYELFANIYSWSVIN